jgi:hypothetical protein
MRDILAEARPSGSPSSAIERLVEARQGLKASSRCTRLEWSASEAIQRDQDRYRGQRDFRRMAGRQGVGAVCRKGWSMAREVRLGGFSLWPARLMFCCFVNLVHAAVSSFQFQ